MGEFVKTRGGKTIFRDDFGGKVTFYNSRGEVVTSQGVKKSKRKPKTRRKHGAKGKHRPKTRTARRKRAR